MSRANAIPIIIYFNETGEMLKFSSINKARKIFNFNRLAKSELDVIKSGNVVGRKDKTLFITKDDGFHADQKDSVLNKVNECLERYYKRKINPIVKDLDIITMTWYKYTYSQKSFILNTMFTGKIREFSKIIKVPVGTIKASNHRFNKQIHRDGSVFYLNEFTVNENHELLNK